MRRFGCLASAAILLAGLQGTAMAQEDIGVTAVAVNQVTGTLAAVERRLIAGNRVYRAEVIETRADSSTQLMFLDQTTLSLGPDSKLVLDTFVFDPDPKVSKVVMTAVQGAFRFVSGDMASSSYEIRTPTTVIGFRGSIADIFVALSGLTVVILRQGIIDVSNLVGDTVTVSQVGLSSTVGGPGVSPTPQGPPPAGIAQMFQLFTGAGPGTSGPAGITLDPSQLGAPPVSDQTVQEISTSTPPAAASTTTTDGCASQQCVQE